MRISRLVTTAGAMALPNGLAWTAPAGSGCPMHSRIGLADRRRAGSRTPGRAEALLSSLAALLLTLGAVVPGSVAAVEVRLEPVTAAGPLRLPVHVTPIPDGSGEMVVVEQDGIIKRFHPRGRREPAVFLDIRGRVSRSGWEEGLLSIAFHPAYADNGLFFVYYSAADPRRSVVARFGTRPGSDGRRMGDPGSETTILEVQQPYANHKGGLLLFGPDGYLYIGLGDGGFAGDPHGHGQDRTTLLGALLRIDVRNPPTGRPYGIPADNPFVGRDDGSRAEIWAYGLRNPWRFSFDRRSGALYLADVGQNAIEEVNRIVRGGNYGWNMMEGRSCFRALFGCDKEGLILPITEYTHEVGSSITGGYVYRGAAFPELVGRYIFADFGSGTFWSIPTDGPADAFREPEVLLRSDAKVSSFGEDADGELYVTDLAGKLYRLAR